MNDSNDDAIERRLREAWPDTPGPDPAARERLHAALRREPAPHRGGWSEWWARPYEFSVSPRAILGCGLLAVALMALLVVRPPTPEPSRVGATAAAASGHVVGFVFVAPEARSVSLVGDFNDWNPVTMPMRRAAGDGAWTIDVPLERGLHLYGFVVDGTRWATDPSAPLAPPDPMGARNSLLVGEEL